MNFQDRSFMPSIYQDLKIAMKAHCMKSAQIRSFFWSVFSHIRTEYGGLRSKSQYSVLIRENTDQKKLRILTLFTQWQCVLATHK